jgi:uncharacterized radical SAM superfamily protein
MTRSELNLLYQKIFGRALKEVKDPLIVIDALKKGTSNIITEMIWGEHRDGEYHERHKIVLLYISENDRVVFYNPMGNEGTRIGAILGGNDMDPVRRVEGINRESVPVDAFIDFFTERDAACYFPED